MFQHYWISDVCQLPDGLHTVPFPSTVIHRIVSTGIDVRRDRRPVPILEPLTGLYVELSGTAGLAIVTWNKVKHARMFMLEYGPIDGPKIQRPVNGQRKVILHEMPLGTTYQFRVAAMGQSDWGPWATRGIA